MARVPEGRAAVGQVRPHPDWSAANPAGLQSEFTGRPLDLAIRPHGKTATMLNAQGSALVVLDVADSKVLQTFGVSGTTASFAGIAYSAKGDELYASGANGEVTRASVGADGKISAAHTIALTAPIPTPAGSPPQPTGARSTSHRHTAVYGRATATDPRLAKRCPARVGRAPLRRTTAISPDLKDQACEESLQNKAVRR
jgi:hypothetical protein